MGFVSIEFILMFSLFFTVYVIFRPQYRYVAIAAFSLLFYYFNCREGFLVIFCSTVLTYLYGLALGRWNKRCLYILFLCLNLWVLVVFKYAGLASAINGFGISGGLTVPIGLSFYIFQTTTYLGDVFHNKVNPEKNLIRYMAFALFFPTVMMGPIQKARNLLPQFKRIENSDFEIGGGYIQFAWGLFSKVIFANGLQALVSHCFNPPEEVVNSSVYSILGALFFSVYIYADFTSYSDMAIGISKIMGIKLNPNFKAPYLSVSISEFWRRWHISLSEWFKEYIYFPLGGSQKGKARTYFNLLVVFAVSGIWHGTGMNFLVWGLLNGLFAIAGTALMPVKDKIYKKLGAGNNDSWVIWLKRIGVFLGITFTWIFFNNTMSECLNIFNSIRNFKYVLLWDSQMYTDIFGSAMETMHILSILILFICIQTDRHKNRIVQEAYSRLPVLLQTSTAAVLLVTCVIAICAPSATVNTDFIYYHF